MKKAIFALLALAVSLSACNPGEPIEQSTEKPESTQSSTRPTEPSSSSSVTSSSVSSTDSSIDSSSTPSSSSIESSQASDTGSSSTGGDSSDEPPASENASIELITFGDLYPNSMRSVFADVEGLDTYTLTWSSSDDSVLKVSPREGSKNEAFLIVVGLGTATVTCRVNEREDLHASRSFTISEGEAMPEELYTKVDGGVTVHSDDKLLDYDENFDSTLVQKYRGTTVFEETNPEDQSSSNFTDAYQFDLEDLTHPGSQDEMHLKYVRTNGSKVGVEYITDQNQVASERVYNEDDEAISWENSYYCNLLNEEDPEYGYFGRDKFRTYDGGHTYHYVGGYLGTSYLMANYLLIDVSLDDLYFTLNEDDSLTLTGVIDPYNSTDPASQIRYGREITFTYSDIDTAQIDHLKPYEHEAYHDRIDLAKNRMAEARNYTVDIDYTFQESRDEDYTVTMRFTQDTIDQVLTDADGNIEQHTGIHAIDGGERYIEYSYNDVEKSLNILTTHEQAWDEVNRYPTFDFASEIFEETEDPNTYITREDSATFISYCVYLSAIAEYSSYIYPGTITLDDDGNLVSVHADTREYQVTTNLAIDASYTEVGTTSVDIDFEGDVTIPTSWKDDPTASDVLGFLERNDILDRVPYLYSEVGYEGAYHVKMNEPVNMYITTEEFPTEEERDQFIADYTALLISNGYTDSGEQLNEYPYEKYTNDLGYQAGVGPELNWNDKELLSVCIVFAFPDRDSYLGY